jgi:hypothetical protein
MDDGSSVDPSLMSYESTVDDAPQGPPPVIRPPSEQETYTTEDGTKMYSIHTDYLGEDVDRSAMPIPQAPGYTNVTHYNDDAEKEESLSYVDEDGRYRSSDGSLLDSTGTERIHAGGIGGHLFTLDESGQSYVVDAKAKRDELNEDQDQTGVHQYVHHSTLSGGDPVAAAGEKYFEEGQLKAISDQSGHFFDMENKREATQTQQAILSDLDAGADLSGTNVHLVQKTLPDGTVIPETDSTVDEFLDAEADQELLYTLQLSAQEEFDRQALGNQPPAVDGGYIEGDEGGENNE